MGYGNDQLGNCVFHICMGWRGENGGNVEVNGYVLPLQLEILLVFPFAIIAHSALMTSD